MILRAPFYRGDIVATIDGNMQGFLEYTTALYAGFTDQNIHDFSQMLKHLQSTGRYQSVVDFFSELERHLYGDPKAHALPINEWSTDLINRLYFFYRNAGFQGTIADMLTSVIKLVDLAEQSDYDNPVSAKKAVQLKGFAQALKRHCTSEYSHPRLSKMFHPVREVNSTDPGLHFTATLPHSYDLLVEGEGVPVEHWNEDAGEIFFALRYTSPNNPVCIPLFTVHYENTELQVRYEYGPEVPSCIRVYKDDTRVLSFKTKYNQSGMDVFSITWSDALLSVSNGESTQINPNPFPSSKPQYIKINVPIGSGDIHIQEWTYYPAYFSPNAQQILF